MVSNTNPTNTLWSTCLILPCSYLTIFLFLLFLLQKITFALTFLVAGASAFAPLLTNKASTVALFDHPKIGAGGMADTRDPDALVHEDPRKSISEAPSFEEYLKMRQGGGAAAPAAAAPAAAAPAAAAPAAAAPAGGGGDVLSTLASLQGPGQVWGAEGIAVGKEENDLKGYDSFGKFTAALKSTGVANELSGAGPFTIFAPVDTAIETYEMMKGPITADVLKLHIVKGKVPSSAVSSADLSSLAGPLKYRYAVRKHFINDVIIGEKTFGPYADYPMDVACSNGVIHGISTCF